MGCVYCGFNYYNRKNGYFKIGETSYDTPAARLANIKRKEHFQCLGYVILKNETRAERLYIESAIRLYMERAGFQNVGNDHFSYEIQQGCKYEQAEKMAKQVINWIVEICNQFHIEYEIGNRTYKRG